MRVSTRRVVGTICVAALGAVASASTCENQDYLTGPTLDVPATSASAPVVHEVINPYDALTTVDFIVYNTGTTPMTVDISATTLALATDEAGDVASADTGDAGTGDTGSDVGSTADTGVRSLTVTGGGSTVGRFSARDLGTGISVSLEVSCVSATCDGHVDWVILLGQVGCRSNEDCAADEVCDEQGRTCVQEASGCSTVGGTPPWTALIALALLGLGTVRRRGSWAATAATVAVVVVIFAPSTASAQRSAFDRATAQLSVGTGVRTWTGKLADETKSGLSLNVIQAIQYRNLGFQLALGTTYYLTTQRAPPLSKGLQTYSLRLGPRFHLPIWVFQIYVDAEYERLGFISNSLVKLTGDELGFHALGGAGGFRWVPAPFFIDVRAGYTEVFGLNSGQISVALSVGLAGQM